MLLKLINQAIRLINQSIKLINQSSKLKSLMSDTNLLSILQFVFAIFAFLKKSNFSTVYKDHDIVLICFLSLRFFGLLSSSLLLFPQRFGQYVLRPSSGVCRTRKPSRNFKLHPLLKPLYDFFTCTHIQIFFFFGPLNQQASSQKFRQLVLIWFVFISFLVLFFQALGT